MNGRMYTAEVIADSISEECRITTVAVIYPHAVHKDMLRHRCMNRNVESFRAQKPEDLIANLRNGQAFKPDIFAKRSRGMGQSHEEVAEANLAADLWDEHVEHCCQLAERFVEMDVAKQQINFLLQDLCPLIEIITATDWSNFYALRTELKDDGTPVARPEVYKTAVAIRDVIEASTPVDRDLHLPLLTAEELPVGEPDTEYLDFLIGVSAGRCARYSYGAYRWQDEVQQAGYDRSRRLLQFGHMSPFEQQARAFSLTRWVNVRSLISAVFDRVTTPGLEPIERAEISRQLEYSGNLHGWVPARKGFLYEWDYALLREKTAV